MTVTLDATTRIPCHVHQVTLSQLVHRHCSPLRFLFCPQLCQKDIALRYIYLNFRADEYNMFWSAKYSNSQVNYCV